MTKTNQTTQSDVKTLIKIIKASDKHSQTLTQFIKIDLESNKGQIICLTAQHIYSEEGSQAQTLNTLQRTTKRVSADKNNELEPVKVSRVCRKSHECELMPNMKAKKDFCTFTEIEKLINRKEGKTANNLKEEDAQALIQMIGKLFA